ncbi:MAG: SET domain-containing protein-lysine N-methyltransferase [Oxalobacteraceae bacterium]|nr:SET domain-containing protein-lysine N-methyltransferase [Oxalobacteraceae bacterium]
MAQFGATETLRNSFDLPAPLMKHDTHPHAPNVTDVLDDSDEPEHVGNLKYRLHQHLKNEVYCKLGVSTIHGVGVFALRDIPKGTLPLQSMVSRKEKKFSRTKLKEIPKSVRKHLADFCLIESGRVFVPEIGMNAVNISIYLNHSKTPNLGFNKQDVLEALRDVARGEELTIDYDLSFGEEHVFDDKELTDGGDD